MSAFNLASRKCRFEFSVPTELIASTVMVGLVAAARTAMEPLLVMIS